MAKETLYGRIYHDLLASIQNGRYKKGALLPSEKELAQRYGVSRITSQKALSMLAESGYITRVPGRGSYVQDKEGKAESTMAEARPVRKGLIGLVTARIDMVYGTRLLMAVERQCAEKGFTLAVKFSGTEELEARCIDELLAIGVEGLIVVCMHGETYSERILRLAIDRFPIVLLDRGLKGIPISFVGTDNVQASKALVEYLLQRGHREICCVTHMHSQIDVIVDREDGFRSALLEQGYIAEEEKDFLRTDFWAEQYSWDQSVARIQAYILRHPEKTAYMAVEHGIAEMVQAAIARCSVDRQPQIVSFDSLQGSIYENVYTHIEQDENEMGRQAVDVLAQLIEGSRQPQTVYVPYRLVAFKKW